MRFSRLVVGILCLLPQLAAAAPIAGAPASPTSWQCTVRCYRDHGGGRQSWLTEKNDLITACADFPDGIQSAIDLQCRTLYGEGKAGENIHGYLNWPAAPGTLAACKNVGTKCATGKPYRTLWECGMHCQRGGDDYPTRASICAPSQRSAYQAALKTYRTGGSRPVCRTGYELVRELGTHEFGDPGSSMCRNTEKECELAP